MLVIKINYHAFLIAFVLLTIILTQMGNADNTPPVPPPLPTLTSDQQAKVMKETKENFRKMGEVMDKENSWKPLFPENLANPDNYHYSLSSRSGRNFKPDYSVDNLSVTARSIYPEYVNWVPNFEFSRKDFYRAYFSIAVNIDYLNRTVAKLLKKNTFPLIYRGAVVYIEISDKKTAEVVYTAWGKIAADTQKDFIAEGKNYVYADDKICLAVASQQEIEFFQGKVAKLYFYITTPPSQEYITIQKQNQKVLDRPAESIQF